MEDGYDVPRETNRRIETADGERVFLFRYDNPQVPNRNPNSEVSHEDLVGKWFTDSPESLKTYIRMRPPGGSIAVAEVPKDKLEELKAINHPDAKDMDIEPIDNYIVPDELLEGARTVPLTVPSENPKKFPFKEWRAIGSFVDDIVDQLKQSND